MCSKVCGVCGVGSMHGMGKYFLVRIILGLAILAIVFCVGVKIGEFKAEFLDGYGYNMMYRIDRMPMMNQGYQNYNVPPGY